MKKTGAQILIEGLIREKVDVIFGFPGGVLLDIYDQLFDTPIRHILTRHEQGAAHAADGYARATGKVGVCIATSGPGATNLVTGIATAYMDSVPIVAITGQVPTPLIGGDAFQEADIVGITRPITKHSYLAQDANDLPRIIHEAFHIARTGRPGPVLIDMPKDVSRAEAAPQWADKVVIRGYNPVYKGNMAQIKKAVQALETANRPIIYAGGGVIISGAEKELKSLAASMKLPVAMTLLGLGGFPGTHKLSLGMLGMHGTFEANMAISESDLIFAIGARFDDRVTGKIEEFAPHAKIIHIDIDPSAIAKNVRVDIPIVGDVKTVLIDLLDEIKKRKMKPNVSRNEWLGRINDWREERPLTVDQPPKGEIKPQYVVRQLYEITKGDAIIATEVGQNQMWAAQFYKYDRPRGILSSGGLGTMGYGLPAAIGAQIGCPDRTVVDIAGDGSIQMNIQELATAAQNRLPVKVVILNNYFLGMVRQWQELFYDKRYSHTCLVSSPDFARVAEAFGVKGLKADKVEDVAPVLKEGLAHDGPVVMDFIVRREENVFPMVPAGAAIRDMLFEPPGKKPEK